jgi:type VI secretion system ImpA family protein
MSETMTDETTETEEEDGAEDSAPPSPPPDVADDPPPEPLLAPLEGTEGPCGPVLRYEGTFDAIREARRDEDPTLPQGVWETDVKRADWPAVARLCAAALSEKSKDLHLALWLTEAWTHVEGLAGFRRGLDLTNSLLEEYWAEIHPQIEEDGDLDYRLGPLRWASEQFPRLLRLVPITAPATGDARPMRLKDHEDVVRIEALAKRDADAARREAKRYPARAEWEASVEATPLGYVLALVPVLEACQRELERLDLILEEHCPKEAPSLSAIRGVLGDIESRLHGWVTAKGGVLPGEEEDDAPAGPDAPETPDAPESPGEEEDAMADRKTKDAAAEPGTGPIRSRAEAYRRLSEAADYLIRTEPHSPVPYVVKRAVEWGDLSFGELLVELVEGGGDHQRVLRLLGLDELGRKKTPKDKG